jgi:hypothetical protein
MERIRVALFLSRAEAAPLRRRLRQAGIPAEIHDELGLARLWFVSRAAAGARLEVPAERAEEAAQLLLAWDADGGTVAGAIRCPECSSLRVEYPQFTHKSLLTNLALGLAAEMRLVDKGYYCEDCHCMWSRPGRIPPRPRRHTAPQYFID